MEAALPQDEKSRLEVLRKYQVLDTPPEQEFDDLVQLAAYICHTPISLVSLVDADRQWFKGRYGLKIEETPRRISFCAHSILQPYQVSEVPDATKDPRFADNELVTGELHVRHYAAAPLVTPEGAALGTLCVIDHKPRKLTPEQIKALKTLSRQVMMQLELRRRVAECEMFSKQLLASQEVQQRQLENLKAFSSTLSHDMRAPTRAIRSFVEIVLRSDRDRLRPQTVELLGKIISTVGGLDKLITDVLAFSRTSRTELELKSVDLDDILESVLATELYNKAHVQVSRPLGQVMANETALRQCVRNLLENAVKFVRPDVEPAIRVFTELTNHKTRKLIVADNGIGIPPEAQETIFGAFQRLRPTEYEGTGIGLAIVKRAAERMGGHVGVESEVGKGSQFWIELKAVDSGH